MKYCNLSVGDWIIIENCYAYVLATHDIYYEVFNSEVQKNSSLQGKHVHSLVAYRIYCTIKGKRINRKSSYFTYEIEDYRMLTSNEQVFISNLLESDICEFEKWKNDSILPAVCEHIRVPVQFSSPKRTMNKFKKAIKQLPCPFTFTDLLKVCSDIKSINWNQIEDEEDSCISFTLSFTVGNHKDNCILFDKIKHINYTDLEENKLVMEQFFTFESAFLSLARFVKEYNAVYPSEKNEVLLARLKEIWSGLFHHHWKKQPLAFDFFTHAPKEQSYSYKLAYETLLKFLQRNVQGLDCQNLIDYLLEEETRKGLYKKAYELIKGM